MAHSVVFHWLAALYLAFYIQGVYTTAILHLLCDYLFLCFLLNRTPIRGQSRRL